jgi:hypothetical protein
MSAINFRNVPRQALIDAMRNNNVGGGGMSRWSKSDLVLEATRALNRLTPDRAQWFRQDIEAAIAEHLSAKESKATPT